MIELFKPKTTAGNPNDPYMINKKGFKVQVQESRVRELLAQGFTLVDASWQPTIVEETRPIDRDFPEPLEKLKEETSKKLDQLEVTEI